MRVRSGQGQEATGSHRGFKWSSVVVREGWRLGWRGQGWRPATSWEATEMVAVNRESGQWGRTVGWGFKDVSRWNGHVVEIPLIADPSSSFSQEGAGSFKP